MDVQTRRTGLSVTCSQIYSSQNQRTEFQHNSVLDFHLPPLYPQQLFSSFVFKTLTSPPTSNPHSISSSYHNVRKKVVPHQACKEDRHRKNRSRPSNMD